MYILESLIAILGIFTISIAGAVVLYDRWFEEQDLEKKLNKKEKK